jgi:putative hydroxymethylpyrimidine transport system substrate-binding protein
VPTFYELVLIASDRGIARRQAVLKRFIEAVQRGITFTQQHPDAAFADYVRANLKLDDEFNRRSFRATLPFFARSQVQDRATWEAFDQWLAGHKVIPHAVPVGDLFVNLAP